MIIQYVAGAIILSAVAASVVRLQLIDRRETKRRASLPPQDQKRLKHEDASWSQKFGF